MEIITIIIAGTIFNIFVVFAIDRYVIQPYKKTNERLYEELREADEKVIEALRELIDAKQWEKKKTERIIALEEENRQYIDTINELEEQLEQFGGPK